MASALASPALASDNVRVVVATPRLSLACGDACAFLDELGPESVDLLFLDPPFNLKKAYGDRTASCDSLPLAKYERFLEALLESSERALRPGGSLFLYHLPQFAAYCSAILGRSLTFRHWIAISMKSGFPKQKHLYPAHYALLYYTKGEPISFRRPKVALQKCRHCQGIVKDYGGYLKYVSEGVSLSDVWDDLSPVRHNKIKRRSANELPARIYERIIEIAGAKDHVYCEPFCGSGKGIHVARTASMIVRACDADQSECDRIATELGD